MNDSLIKQALNGDFDAFSELYNHYAEKALRLSMSITRSETLAADSVQEAFLRVFRKGKQFNSEYKFETWFFRIIINESKRILSKNKTESELDENISISGFTPASDRSIDIKQALEQLTEEQRIILTLRYINDYTEKTIAKIIGKPVGTVKSRLFYAKKQLAEILGGERSAYNE